MDELIPLLFAYWWIWIPIAGIFAGSFKDWLKSKERLAELGTSTDGLGESFKALRTENEELVRRLQNLEAIVTHEVWEAANAKQDPMASAARIDSVLLSPEPSDADRAAHLAGRLRS
jgi:hypothetical protein